ncbi:hypothetical protein Bhyg_02218 [Pseudolycoriella hygida]|uniref:MD-2-related lipid-recognition domain-containing protein n=1 Tax=Pseudolycoriella hygida TaxID=35572 RepID=A0A9Q0S862_9DIPT|nr:hypothetical protein Bhyg_02218 [Pseudolycoriella hygida]
MSEPFHEKEKIEYMKCVTDIANDEKREKVGRLLKRYKPAVGGPSLLKMEILLQDNIPVYQHPRRLSREVSQKMIDEFIQEGIVRPSKPPYASPILLRKKPNGRSSKASYNSAVKYCFSFSTEAVNSTSVPFTVSAAFPGFGSFNFIQGEGCDVLLLGTCPIKSGNLYLGDFTYYVGSGTPTGYAVMEINVNDDSHNTIICAQFFGIIGVN